MFSSVGSLSLPLLLSLSLSDLNKQLSKEEASSEPVNTHDGSKAKFRVTAQVALKIQTLKAQHMDS